MQLPDSAPHIQTAIPGPRSQAWVDRLALRECPAITARRARRAMALGAAQDDPIVWDRAEGLVVTDVDGNRFIDLTAGFGVAGLGHAHPAVVSAAKKQMDQLVHVMGDAYPETQRVRLLECLAARTGLDRAILGSSGSDAVEAALKTARMATGRDRVVAFEAGYHGLSYGALTVTGYNADQFRAPFAGQLGGHVHHAEFGGPLPALEGVGAVIVEPIQGRGGIRVPPAGWLAALQDATHAAGALLIVDEIYTGFGRAGTWFAFQHEGLRPDLVCLGKGMAGGFPVSACIGTADAMDAWGASTGMALHTQTFLGHPVGCAAALACIEALDAVIPAAAQTGTWLVTALQQRGYTVRGRGLMLGIVLPDALEVSRRLLQSGYIALPAGERGEVLALTPPLTIDRSTLERFLDTLDTVRA
jgi:4-aminobutyrate aminotransferase/(S)-3-amino-2-methylpropionate transaminase